MRNAIRLALTCLLAASLTACEDDLVLPPPDIPSTPAVVRLVPDDPTIDLGNLLTVEIRIENGFDVGSVPFHLIFNGNYLDFEPPGTEGTFLSSGGAPTTFLATEDPPGGEIVVVLVRSGTGPGAIGSGLLATFRFRAIQAGRVALTFSAASVKDPDGANLPASFVGGSVMIGP